MERIRAVTGMGKNDDDVIVIEESSEGEKGEKKETGGVLVVESVGGKEKESPVNNDGDSDVEIIDVNESSGNASLPISSSTGKRKSVDGLKWYLQRKK